MSSVIIAAYGTPRPRRPRAGTPTNHRTQRDGDSGAAPQGIPMTAALRPAVVADPDTDGTPARLGGLLRRSRRPARRIYPAANRHRRTESRRNPRRGAAGAATGVADRAPHAVGAAVRASGHRVPIFPDLPPRWANAGWVNWVSLTTGRSCGRTRSAVWLLSLGAAVDDSCTNECLPPAGPTISPTTRPRIRHPAEFGRL